MSISKHRHFYNRTLGHVATLPIHLRFFGEESILPKHKTMVCKGEMVMVRIVKLAFLATINYVTKSKSLGSAYSPVCHRSRIAQ